MSFMDKAKDALTQAKGKAADLAEQHGDKIDQGINKAGDFVDKKTGGKYADKIDSAQSKARAGADKLAAERTTATGAVVTDPVVVTPVTPVVVDPTPAPTVVHPLEPGITAVDPVVVDPAAKSSLKGDLVDDRGPESTRTDPSI